MSPNVVSFSLNFHLVIRALGKMIIGHLNLIRLVLLALLLSITVEQILPGEEIFKDSCEQGTCGGTKLNHLENTWMVKSDQGD